MQFSIIVVLKWSVFFFFSYTGLDLFWALKVQSKLVCLGWGWCVPLKTVNIKNKIYIKTLIKLFYEPLVIKNILLL